MPIKADLRELRDDLQRLIMRTIEMEQRMLAISSGQLKLDLQEQYSRSHTGTWRGRALEDAARDEFDKDRAEDDPITMDMRAAG